MVTRTGKPELLPMFVLLVNDKPRQDSAVGHAARILLQDLQEHYLEAIISASAEDGQAVIDSDPHLQCRNTGLGFEN